MDKIFLGKVFSSKMAMELSIAEAKKGRGWVSPNPPVGCVILDKNQCLLSTGYHTAYGKDHAEIEALKKIKNKKNLEGAHVYVTLEPCNHQGKTPPCLRSLMEHSLSSVHYGQKDLNPKVKGRSIEELKSKGIVVKEYAHFKKNIKDLYEIFNCNMIQQQAFVSLKVASSLDGIIGLSDGSSEWITSHSSRDYVSDLRAYHDSVLIGVRTFLEDNPRLNSRKAPFHKKRNKVVILDPSGRSLKLIESSNLFKVRSLSDIIVVTKSEQNSSKIKTICCPWNSFKNQFDLKKLKSSLYLDFGICSLLVEGGAHTFSSFLEQDQVEILYQFLNPSIIGGGQGISWSDKLNCISLKHKKSIKLIDNLSVGEDILLKFSFLKQEKLVF